MSDVDWSKAPEGATHYAPRREDNCMYRPVFWRVVGDRGVEAWAINADGSLQHYAAPAWMSDDLSRLIPRPATPQWNGEGLPPVGAVVEAFYMGIPQGVVTVRYAGQCMILWSGERNSEQCGAAEHYLFRPIRTPEQLAAEAREKAVEEMWSVYWQPHAVTAKEGLGLLYDAGYRKQEQPE